MKILVTGGAGFIGSAVIRHLLAATDHHVVNVDKLTYAADRRSLGTPEASGRYSFEQIDICDAPAIRAAFERHAPDAIMHLAAESHVDRSIDGPGEFVRTNILGTYVLLDAALAYWRGLEPERASAFRFHHISTDEVFGELDATGLFTEETPYDPSSPYSASKASSDHLVRAWHRTYKLPTVVSNCSNNYGPYQFPEKLIPLTILSALEGRPIPVYGRGENVRDWLHVEDHCRGIELSIERGRAGEVYNIGGGQELPNITVVDEICRGVDAAFAKDATLAIRFPDAPAAQGRATAEIKTYVEDRKGHDRRYAIDETKVRAELGYVPARDFTQGFAETLGWYLANEAWWKAILAR